MGSFAFLVLVLLFATVVGWYVLNVERDENGTAGPLRIRADATTSTDPDTSDSLRGRAGAARIRARVTRGEASSRSEDCA
jgi:hypothetical protein